MVRMAGTEQSLTVDHSSEHAGRKAGCELVSKWAVQLQLQTSTWIARQGFHISTFSVAES